MALEFDPYKRPPAARLLAILVSSLLIAWLTAGGARMQNAQLQRDPAKYYKHVADVAHRSPMADVVLAIVLVTIVVFAVDGLTSLFGRWLGERHRPEVATDHPASAASARAGALLGDSEPPAEGV